MSNMSTHKNQLPGYPEVGVKQKTEREKREKEKKRTKISFNNGQVNAWTNKDNIVSAFNSWVSPFKYNQPVQGNYA